MEVITFYKNEYWTTQKTFVKDQIKMTIIYKVFFELIYTIYIFVEIKKLPIR